MADVEGDGIEVWFDNVHSSDIEAKLAIAVALVRPLSVNQRSLSDIGWAHIGKTTWSWVGGFSEADGEYVTCSQASSTAEVGACMRPTNISGAAVRISPPTW
ncbi:hypothetical protein N7466_004052 [Penicillium verhagenii]|uniref:uncharacterized protein n=1 Tax=Penicillium verhagenii TaxID=1562060 RepID=UPI0025453F66|nr:uncharacterized protein N7466_004052 [Penicillium verhagenii]KAJ5934505.1 hypothetical protein N7466_004052 [Penicillium verhagenii]